MGGGNCTPPLAYLYPTSGGCSGLWLAGTQLPRQPGPPESSWFKGLWVSNMFALLNDHILCPLLTWKRSSSWHSMLLAAPTTTKLGPQALLTQEKALACTAR